MERLDTEFGTKTSAQQQGLFPMLSRVLKLAQLVLSALCLEVSLARCSMNFAALITKSKIGLS